MRKKQFKEAFQFEWLPEMVKVTTLPQMAKNVEDIAAIKLELNIKHALELINKSYQEREGGDDEQQKFIDNLYNEILYMDKFSFVRPLGYKISLYCQECLEDNSDNTKRDIINTAYSGELVDLDYQGTVKHEESESDDNVSVMINEHKYELTILIPRESKLFKTVMTSGNKRNKIIGITTDIEFACMSNVDYVTLSSGPIDVKLEDLIAADKKRTINISSMIDNDMSFVGRRLPKVLVSLDNTKVFWYRKHRRAKHAVDAPHMLRVGKRNVGEVTLPKCGYGMIDNSTDKLVRDIDIAPLFAEPEKYKKGYGGELCYTIECDLGLGSGFSYDHYKIVVKMVFYTNWLTGDVMMDYSITSPAASDISTDLMLLMLSTNFIFHSTIDKEDWEEKIIDDVGNNEENLKS